MPDVPHWNGSLSQSQVKDQPDDLLLSTYLADEDFICYFGVPLVAKGVVKGVLEVFHLLLKPDQEWLDFLQNLAGQAAIAIDNAQLFENLQRSNIKLTLAYDATIEGWSRAMDLRDRETEDPAWKVTELTVELAGLLGSRMRIWWTSAASTVPRYRQNGNSRYRPAQTGGAHQRRMGHHEEAPNAGLRDALSDRLPENCNRHPPLPSREMGRQRLPAA